MYFDKDQFFQGFEVKALKEKVSAIKVFYIGIDDENAGLAFACEGEAITLDERKIFKSHFDKLMDKVWSY